MSERNWLEFGIIDRVHGLQGAVVLRIAKGIPLDMVPGVSTLFIDSLHTKIPYSIIRSSPPAQGGMVVWLEDVNHRDEARKLLGSVVWIQKTEHHSTGKKTPIETLTDYLGFRVVLADEVCTDAARLSDVQVMPGQIMLEIEEPWGNWLCPFQPAFLTAVDPTARIITLKPPGGLRALYLAEHED